MVVPGGSPLIIMCTWSGLKYWQPCGGKVTVPLPLSGSRQGSPGLTVMVKLQSAPWPHASVAAQITVFVPIGNVLPLGGLQLTVTGGQPPLVEMV